MPKKRKRKAIEVANLDRLVANYKLSKEDSQVVLETAETVSGIFPNRLVKVSFSVVESFPKEDRLGEYLDTSLGKYGYGHVRVLKSLAGNRLAMTTGHELTHAVCAQSGLRQSPSWDEAWDLLQKSKANRKMLRQHGRRWVECQPDYFERRGDQMRLEEYLCDQIANYIGRRLGTSHLPQPDQRILELLTAI